MLLTYGHGTDSAEGTVATLHAAAVSSLADIRIAPGSKRNPRFTRAALEEWLPRAGIAYRWEKRTRRPGRASHSRRADRGAPPLPRAPAARGRAARVRRRPGHALVNREWRESPLSLSGNLSFINPENP
ncbi:MAG: DUF488 family protein, partial [Trebonia sp.]